MDTEAKLEGGPVDAVAGQEQTKMTHQRNRALVKQPLALQWFEDGLLKKRSDDERQAGLFSKDQYPDRLGTILTFAILCD